MTRGRQNEISSKACEYMRLKCNMPSLDELIIRAFEDGARWVDNNPHWISVEDELPPQNEAYLAYWQHLGVTKYRYVKAGAKVSRTFSEHITHWMPLPQPPKGGGEE